MSAASCLEALVSMDVPQVIEAADLVPGDVILLAIGNIVPADVKLLGSNEDEPVQVSLGAAVRGGRRVTRVRCSDSLQQPKCTIVLQVARMLGVAELLQRGSSRLSLLRCHSFAMMSCSTLSHSMLACHHRPGLPDRRCAVRPRPR